MRPTLALLAVSLFKPELQGDLLEGHVSLINDLDVSECVVSLGDTLHRHNLPTHLDGGERYAVAATLGDKWTEREKPALDGLAMPWRMMRHDEMLAQASFVETFVALRSFLRNCPSLADALRHDVEAFIARAGRDEPDLRHSSEMYILEELAADIAFSRTQAFTYIYPGKPLEIYRAMQALAPQLPTSLRGLERCAFLRTRVRKGRVRAVR